MREKERKRGGGRAFDALCGCSSLMGQMCGINMLVSGLRRVLVRDGTE